MLNITVRNIPDDIVSRIKSLAELDKRSLNNEILIILEKGLNNEVKNKYHFGITKETQTHLWEKLSGAWQDNRATHEIIDDIYDNRSFGREFDL